MDRLFVREDGCPFECRCEGVADAYSKGSFCSEISQDPTVQAGVGGVAGLLVGGSLVQMHRILKLHAHIEKEKEDNGIGTREIVCRFD